MKTIQNKKIIVFTIAMIFLTTLMTVIITGCESNTTKVTPVTGITLNQSTLTLDVGSSETLIAVLVPSNATNKNVIWSSSRTSVATVSNNGVVTGVGEGTAVITVVTADGGFSATCNVTVNPPFISVTGVALNKTSTSILTGGSETLTANITPANATNQNVSWSSSNTSVATVNNSGVVTGISVGLASITVTTEDGGFQAVCEVNVSDTVIPVTGVSLNKSDIALDIDEIETLIAIIEPENATNQNVSWSSSDSSVANVSETGAVTGLAEGNAIITVITDDGGFTSSCNVIVSSGVIKVTGVALNKSSTSIIVGDTETLTAIITPENATNQNVSWTSSNTAVATVNSAGVVLSVSIGTTDITVTTEDGGFQATCVVTVTDLPPTVTAVTVTPANVTVSAGEMQIFEATVTGTNNPPQEVTWSVSGSTAGSYIEQNGYLYVNANESAQTLTVTATSTFDNTKSGNATVTIIGFGGEYNVHDTASWNAAVNGVRNGGNNKKYIIYVNNNIQVPISNENTFGNVSGVEIVIQGNATISRVGNALGQLLQIRYSQTVIVLGNIVFQGIENNNTSVIRISNGGTLQMEGSTTITGNSNSGHGGGVLNSGGTLIMKENSSIKNNTVIAGLGLGGGVSMNDNGTIIMLDNSFISENTVIGGGGGGGVYITTGSLTMKDNSSISNNSVLITGYSSRSSQGGGVYVSTGGQPSSFVMEGGTISNNIVDGGIMSDARGGGVYVVTGTNFTMYSGSIISNTATQSVSSADSIGLIQGGGVFVQSGTFTMHNGQISNNKVKALSANNLSGSGGGVYGNSGGIIMHDGIISGNTVEANRNVFGGGVYGRLTMHGGIIRDNTVSSTATSNFQSLGGGVYAVSTFTKNGGIIYGHDVSSGLMNYATNGNGHAIYMNGPVQWRNATAWESDSSDDYGFWMND